MPKTKVDWKKIKYEMHDFDHMHAYAYMYKL